MSFFASAADIQLINYWAQCGYEIAEWHDSIDERNDDMMLKHLAFFEFATDLAIVEAEEEEKLRFRKLRPYLLQSFVRGYQSYANN